METAQVADPHQAHSGTMALNQLFLDCDGVLADFDRAAEAIFGMPPRQFEKQFGLSTFWSSLARSPDFYGSLTVMSDARRLFDAVRHLEPIILTGCPRGGWAEVQKVRWAANHFPGTRIITCMARDKRQHGRPGDVLIDDTLRHRHLWEEMGGTFIHHVNANRSLEDLRKIGWIDAVQAVRNREEDGSSRRQRGKLDLVV